MSNSNVNMESAQVANEDTTSAIGSSEATASDEVGVTALDSPKINDEAIVPTIEMKENSVPSEESLDSTCVEESSCPNLIESEETTSFIDNITEKSSNEHNR